MASTYMASDSGESNWYFHFSDFAMLQQDTRCSVFFEYPKCWVKEMLKMPLGPQAEP